MNKKRNYDKEFKLNAIKLYIKSDCSYPVLGKELGISANTLAGWVNQYKKFGEKNFVGKGNIRPEEEELIQLRKELTRVREERDILKKALGIFSSHPK